MVNQLTQKHNSISKRFAFLQVGPGIGPITNNNFRFARSLEKRGHSVDLVGTRVYPEVIQAAPQNLEIFNLNVGSVAQSISPLARYLKSRLPDFLLPSGPPLHVASGLASWLARYQGKIICRSHIETSLYLQERRPINRSFLYHAMKLTRQFSFKNVAASRGAADDLARLYGIDNSEVGVLYNPAIDDDVPVKAAEDPGHPWLVSREVPVVITVARLAEQKALDVLLKAIRDVRRSRKVRLIVLGEGHLRQELESLANALGISEDVDFHGHVENPYAFVSRANVFALSSEYEGFANVVAEALAVGCPVVSTDAPSGPREILEDGAFGRLVPVGDSIQLGNAILETLEKDIDRPRLVERGYRFHIERIVEDLIDIANG